MKRLSERSDNDTVLDFESIDTLLLLVMVTIEASGVTSTTGLDLDIA